MPPRKRVYLAGDLVFRPEAPTLFERLKTICHTTGLEGCAPFDGQDAIRGLPPGRDTILKIITADRDLMNTCDAGLFCLDPFRRAPDMDPGTAVEIGYMMAQGKPLEGYTTDARPYPEKVAAYWKHAWNENVSPRTNPNAFASGALEDPDGMLLHSDGMVQNGMTEGFITLSGGGIATHRDFETAFRIAAEALAKRLL